MPTIQKDNKGSDYQVNWIAYFNKDHFSKVVIYFIGAIMMSYISPLSAPQPNRLLPNQELTNPYLSDGGLLLKGELKGWAIHKGLAHELPPISPTLTQRDPS